LTHFQKTGHSPGRYPPFPPLLPAFSHVLRYGDFTARGIAGGRAGLKVDRVPTEGRREMRSEIRSNKNILKYKNK
jgi:hypothetical protein